MLPTRIDSVRTLWPSDLSDMDRFFTGLIAPRPRAWAGWRPSADLTETDDGYRVELEVPGFDREKINVALENGVLTITGERSEELEREGENYRVRERSAGTFTRRFSLPSEIDADGVTASLKEGVLSVRIPKLAEAMPKQIEVKID